MRPSLRRTLLELIVATAATLPGCVPPGGAGCPDNDYGEADLYEPLDPALQALVDRCRAAGGFDLAECEPMCHELVVRQTGAKPEQPISACDLYDGEGATGATAQASWTVGPECVGGRRPDGYVAARCDRGTVGGFLAEQARLEAASVRAFLELAHALEHHRAPRLLIDACRRAAADEIIHAALTGRLAHRLGVTPVLDERATAAPVPSLEALARANAVEGCVRETWGALVATWQAGAAADPAIRAAMRRIAPDETRHATLSRAIDRWAMRRLDDTARARVEAAREQALVELAASVGDVPPALERDAGLPGAAAATALLHAMSDTVAAWPRSSSGAARSSPSTTARPTTPTTIAC